MRLELLVLALSVLIGPAAALMGAPATGAGPWLVVVAPWHPIEEVVARADARMIGPTRAPFGVLVAAKDAGAAQRLAAAGAWAVIDAKILAEFCGVD